MTITIKYGTNAKQNAIVYVAYTSFLTIPRKRERERVRDWESVWVPREVVLSVIWFHSCEQFIGQP